MEDVSDQLPAQPEQPAPEKLRPSAARFDAANDFLTICDRLSTGYGYYWEDVQRALRIAAGLEK